MIVSDFIRDGMINSSRIYFALGDVYSKEAREATHEVEAAVQRARPSWPTGQIVEHEHAIRSVVSDELRSWLDEAAAIAIGSRRDQPSRTAFDKIVRDGQDLAQAALSALIFEIVQAAKNSVTAVNLCANSSSVGPISVRSPPDWLPLLPADLHSLMTEIYSSMNAGMTILPAMGARTAFDQAMSKFVGDPSGGFKGKLDEMKQQGLIDEREIGILHPMIDAGSAASHRAWQPSPDVLNKIIDELERNLHGWFIREAAAAVVKSATPPRRPGP